jgi:Ca2+-binding EF-hand superfamily protein
MGAAIFWGSKEQRRSDHETTDMLKDLSKELDMSLADLEELHYIFIAQHPDGVMLRQVFISDNVGAHGGNEALWDRVFDFAAMNSLDEDLRPVDGAQRSRPAQLNFAQVMLASTQSKKRRESATFERLVKRVFQFLDLHDDGFIDEGELRTVIEWLYDLKETQQLRLSAEVLQKFAAADGGRANAPLAAAANADPPSITLPALAEIYPPLVNPAERAAQIVQWMDLDQDGVICETEFIEACRGDQAFVEAFSFVPS